MKLQLLYRIIITDKEGKIVKRSHWRKSRSFVVAFLQFIEHLSKHAYNVANPQIYVTDITNASRGLSTANASVDKFAWLAPDDTGTYGMVVGTGTTPPTNANYNLETIIAHGLGAGQLDYGAHSVTSAGIVGANVDLVWTRTFYNGSGASITVNEIGIYCQSRTTTPLGDYIFCLIRDVITATAVANTQTLTVQYTLRTTV